MTAKLLTNCGLSGAATVAAPGPYARTTSDLMFTIPLVLFRIDKCWIVFTLV
jgi:hypothetical protein